MASFDPGSAGAGVVGLLLLVLGAAMLFRGWKAGGWFVAMIGTETSSVAEVEPGRVEVQGKVVSAGPTVEGDLGEGEAVVVERRASRKERDPETNRMERQRIPIPQQFAPNALNEISAAPFYVEDDTGRVLVDAATAETSLRSDEKTEGFQEVEVEARLEPGDDVYVLGTAVTADEYRAMRGGAGAAEGSGDGGILGLLRALLQMDPSRIPAGEVLEDEDVVLTGEGGGSLRVMDVAEWRGWLRQMLAVLFWGIVGVAIVAVGVLLVLKGFLGVNVVG